MAARSRECRSLKRSPISMGRGGGREQKILFGDLRVYIPLAAFFFCTPSFTLYGSLRSFSIILDCLFFVNDDNGPLPEGEPSREEGKVKDGVEGDLRRGVVDGLTGSTWRDALPKYGDRGEMEVAGMAGTQRSGVEGVTGTLVLGSPALRRGEEYASRAVSILGGGASRSRERAGTGGGADMSKISAE